MQTSPAPARPNAPPETVQASPTPEALRIGRELSGLRSNAAALSLALRGSP